MSRVSLRQFEIHWEIATLDLHQVVAFLFEVLNMKYLQKCYEIDYNEKINVNEFFLR